MEVILEVIKEKMAETAEDYDKFEKCIGITYKFGDREVHYDKFGKRTGTTHKFGKKEEHYDD